MSLFSESFNLELNDIQLIVGPSLDHMSKEEHFADDPNTCPYDI